jgi:hypothetical protein
MNQTINLQGMSPLLTVDANRIQILAEYRKGKIGGGGQMSDFATVVDYCTT